MGAIGDLLLWLLKIYSTRKELVTMGEGLNMLLTKNCLLIFSLSSS
jgi:hypothetical protein